MGIFKVFKDLTDFCNSKFCKLFQSNETDRFQIFLFAKISHNQPLLFSFLANPNINHKSIISLPQQLVKSLRNGISTHTHTQNCRGFQESKTLKCQSLVSALKLRRNCTSSSLFCLQELQFVKGAEMSGEHYFTAAHLCTLPGK